MDPGCLILQALRFTCTINELFACILQGFGAGCLSSEGNEKSHRGSFFGGKSSVRNFNFFALVSIYKHRKVKYK